MKHRLTSYIRHRLDEMDKTQADLAKALGQTPANVSKKLSGALRISTPERAIIAKTLGFPGLTAFDTAWREHEPQPVKRQAMARIPVINVAPAGVVLRYDGGSSAIAESEDAWEYIPGDDVTSDSSFAVKVVGDSMTPTLLPGDYLVFLTHSPADSATIPDGTIVFVRLSEAAPNPGVTIGRMYRTDPDGQNWRIVKDNRKYTDIVVDREHVEQIAVAIQRRTSRL